MFMCVVYTPSNPHVAISLGLSWTLTSDEKAKKHVRVRPCPWHWPSPPFPWILLCEFGAKPPG